MPERLIFVRSRTTAGSSGWSSSFGISRRWCVACDGEYLVDATCPLLLQTSLKLYGIDGHVVLVLTFVFEGWVRLGSSPSESAQYISASFRYWRLSRRDFATTVRRANSFAFAR